MASSYKQGIEGQPKVYITLASIQISQLASFLNLPPIHNSSKWISKSVRELKNFLAGWTKA